MCRNERRFCRCGRNSASLLLRDNLLYLQSLKSEWLQHVAELKAAGWRKAREA